MKYETKRLYIHEYDCIILIIGSFTGGFLGAHLSKLKGNILIKKTFTIVCLSVGVSLFIKSIMSFLYIN